jgi:hypothetical protein
MWRKLMAIRQLASGQEIVQVPFAELLPISGKWKRQRFRVWEPKEQISVVGLFESKMTQYSCYLGLVRMVP